MPATVLRAAIGDYPHTAALKDGRVGSALLRLDFADIKPISRAFAPMMREGRFDVSEMAIATFAQARARGLPFVLLPVVMAARFQQAALLCRAGGDIAGPADLAGRRVGVRAYSQTTGMWLRGIVLEEFGVRPEQVRWITFEDPHVPGIPDPAWAERAQLGQDMLAMLRDGSLDAVIVGNDVPDDPGLRTVFPDVTAASAAFFARHQLVPVNHMVVVRSALAHDHPDLVRELVHLFAAAAQAAPTRLLAGQEALRPALALALGYMAEQGMLPRPLTVEALWDGLPTL